MKRGLSILLSVLLLTTCIPFGAVAVSATTEPSYDGYITNGDFETGDMTGWENQWGSCITSMVAGRSGGYALQMSTSSAWNRVRQKIAVQPNTDYAIRIEHKNVSDMYLEIKDGADSKTIATSHLESGDDWQRSVCHFNSGSCTEVYICFMGWSANACGTFDNCTIGDQSGLAYDGYLYDGDFESGFLAGVGGEYYEGTAKGWHGGGGEDYDNYDPDSGSMPEWIPYASITNAAAHSGFYGAHLQVPSSGWGFALSQPGIRLGVPGVTYTVSFWCKVNSGELGWALGSSDGFYVSSQVAGDVVSPGGWTYVQQEFVMPSWWQYDPNDPYYSNPSLTLAFESSHSRYNLDAYVDDVLITCTAETVVEDNLMYTIVEESAVLQGFYQVKTSAYGEPLEYVDVDVPAYVNGYPVTAVSAGAFAGSRALCSIALPYTVTAIGDNAFCSCENLQSVSGGENIRTIGRSAFASSPITTAPIGRWTTTIGDYAFHNCPIRSVYVPAYVTSLASTAFVACPLTTFAVDEQNRYYSAANGMLFNKEKTQLLRGVTVNGAVCTIPDSVTSITVGAFSDSGVRELILGDGITVIEPRTFEDCYSLVSVTISDNVTTIGDYAFEGCSSLVSATLGDNVTTIGERAFAYCSKLTWITIPAGVTTIGDDAFYSSYYYRIPLTDVYYGGTAAQREQIAIGSDNQDLTSATWHYNACSHRFDSVYDLDCSRCGMVRGAVNSGTTGDCTWTLYDNDHLVISGEGAMADYGDSTWAPWGAPVAYVTIEEGVTTIGDYAFDWCETLKSIHLPNSLTTIGDRAFYQCESLTSVTLPDSVTTIGESAFQQCYSLTSVTLGTGLTTIGDYAFLSYGITDVYYTGLPSDRTSITIGMDNYFLNIATWHYHWGKHVYDNACDALCDECGEERLVPDHVYDGFCDGECNACGLRREVPDHQYEVEWETIPSCGEHGITIYFCENCGHRYEVYAPATGDHVYDTTCDADCNVCGAVRAAEDHVYDHRFDTDCNLCGETRIAYGDADGDGEITALDVILLQQYFAGYNVTLNEVGADTDGDGEITALDVILLQQYFAGYER